MSPGNHHEGAQAPSAPPVRVITLVLVSPSGDLLGRLPSFQVETPWWQDVRPVVAGARVRFGLQVTILRLLESERPSAPGGAVTYLAEIDPGAVTGAGQTVTLEAWSGTLDEDSRRLPYARPGGPAADLAWADGILAGLGRSRNGPGEQDRTWNLSSLWRLPLPAGAAWLKVVPPFFEHEARILRRLDGEGVPHLLGHDRGRMLFAEIPGSDRYDASGSELIEMVDALVDLQARWSGRIAELLDLGLPDWRAPALGRSIAEVVDRANAELAADDRDVLADFVATLPDRFATIESCGLPEGLVHGDFHPGNVRGERGALVLLDWGDSGVGHPLLDQPAFLTRIDPAEVSTVRDHWVAAWRRAVPGSDPGRASSLLAPVAAARQAVIYQRFLDNIESSEHPYHRADVPDWLRRTAEILRGDRPSSHRRST